MKRPVYHTFQISDGRTVVMHEGDAGDMMDACIEAGGNAAMALYILLTVLCTIDGQSIMMDDLRKLSMSDLTHITEVLSSQMQKV